MRVQSSKFKSSKWRRVAVWVAAVCLCAQGVMAQEGPPELPEPVSSFGAAVLGDDLYVYSGHIGVSHDHSSENLSQGFYRLKLGKRMAKWESLPMQTPLQGLAAVAFEGKVYRVGGLSARNAFDEVEDLHSVDEFARFNPETNEWESLTPLPEARSSHDAVVWGDKLFVLGGWTLKGKSSEAVWSDRGCFTRLRDQTIRWAKLPPQPFHHRALATAATENKIFVIGGINEEGKATNEVWSFTPETMEWNREADMPCDSQFKAFGASAFGVGDTVWASAADGKVYSLTEGADAWVDSGYTLTEPRFFHRLVHQGDRLLFLGGASSKGHLKSIESVDIALLEATPSARLEADSSEWETSSAAGSQTWPGFRGDGTGHTLARNLPAHWSNEQNIAWRIPVEGYGQSSPIVRDGRVYLTSIIGSQQETLLVTAVDADTGQKSWVAQQEASQQYENDGYHAKAAPTSALDDDALYLFFESGDLIAFDHEGRGLWHRALTKEYGAFETRHGMGSSLAQNENAIFVLADHNGPSFLACVEKTSGATRWKTQREPRSAWNSPVVAGQTVIVSSTGAVDAYDVETGELRWRIENVRGNTVCSPTVAGDVVIIGADANGSNMAVEIETGEKLWTASGALAYFASPVVVDGSVYFASKAGVVTCVDLATGKKNWALRLPGAGGCWASPIVSGELIYFFIKDGTTLVLKADPSRPIKVAESKIDIGDGQRVYGVAAVDGAFFVRTGTELIRIARP